MHIKEQIEQTIHDIMDGDASSVWFLVKLMVIGCAHFLVDHPYQAITGYFMIMLMIQRWHRSRTKTEIKKEERGKAEANRLKAESEAREQVAQENITELHLSEMRKNIEKEGMTGEEPGLNKEQ